METITALVIAPEWPGDKSGYQIALKSSLLQYQKKYSVIHYIGLTTNNYVGPNIDFPSVSFSHINVKESSPLIRFLRSLFSIYPAVVRKFIGKKVYSQILRHINENNVALSESKVIIEDLPAAIQMDSLLKLGFKVSIRSHNILGEAFEKLTTNGSLLHRLAWRLEVAKCRKFEKLILANATEVYAISDRDKSEYLKRYGHQITGVVGICYSQKDLASCLSGNRSCSINVILHLGTLDIRKTQGIKKFIQNVWPGLKTKNQDLELILGGKNSERWDNQDLGITGLGLVDNEQEFMDQGVIFINTQEAGTGVNLKSLTAMKYGKILISTKKGLEGINGKSGIHYLAADTIPQMGTLILDVIENYPSMSYFSLESRRLIEENYLCN